MTSTAQQPEVSNRVADETAAALKTNGIPYIFGIPGGGSSIDLIEACNDQDIPFVLTQHETTAAMMAVVAGELTGTCGVCLSIMGPGATNAASGAIYAYLERHPLLCVTECYSPAQEAATSMQKIDHPRFFGPVAKASVTLTAHDPALQTSNAIRMATAERPGTVHIDFPQNLDATVSDSAPTVQPHIAEDASSGFEGDIDAIVAAINVAERPILIAGPVVVRQGAGSNLLSLAERLQAAVMATSKARGVIPENHPLYSGVMSGVYAANTLETRIVDRSDLVVAVGLDRVELLSPWKHTQKLISIDAIPVEPQETVGAPFHTATGNLPNLIDALTDGVKRRDTWDVSELASFWSEAMHQLGAAETTLNATVALRAARRMAPDDAILTTEAGVYGRVNLYAWKVYDPTTYYDSSGSNTMGFSIPAGLAASLVRPGQKTISLIGDAGMLMRLGDLEVATRLKLAPVIVVFDDTTLGMIRVKQRSKGYAREGVDLAQTDFVRLAESFGGVGTKVNTPEEFESAFAKALDANRLHLIDVRLDPDTYAAHVKPIRGS
jgi:acetolactate synthase-1/2/3 large subunit